MLSYFKAYYSMNIKFFSYVTAIMAVTFWGFTFVWVKNAYEYYNPVTTIFLRLIIACLILGPVFFIRKNRDKVKLEHIPWFMLLAFFEPFCYFMGEGFGLLYVSSTLGSMIVATIPLFTPLFALMLFREKMSVMNILGLFVSFFGILVFIVGKDLVFEISLKGIALMFFAVFSSVGHGLVARWLTRDYGSLTIVTMQNIFSLFYFAPVFYFFEFEHFKGVVPTSGLIFLLFKLSVFGSVLAFLLYVAAIKEIGLARTAVFTNLIPVITAAAAFFMLGECLGIYKIAGIFFVILGLFLSQTRFSESLNDESREKAAQSG
ncbi:MAG: DMT family transporter [Oligoflexales bacterium]|nr:DMT family transporter [Oligoflexales bacterium]